MKRVFWVVVLLVGMIGFVRPTAALAYNFGDQRSSTLAGKAWEALAQGDVEAVLAFTNKCIELYGDKAKEMQANLKDYPKGSNQEVFSYWALNDVATCLYIQAEAYRKANMMDEAREVYKKLTDEYSFGQCWDTKGWFWKPAEAAKEKLAMMESGLNVDFGDYTSQSMTTKAWQALGNNELDAVLAYTNKTVSMYADKAKEMQASLKEYPWESKEKIFSYWALNDVGTALYIQGEAYQNAGKTREARAAFQKLVDEYSFAQCWDPQGWFWKPAEAARQKMATLVAEK